MIPLVPVDGKTMDWPRRVANAANSLIRIVTDRETLPFQSVDAEPDDPVEGQAYYDTAMHKLRVYDGTAWQNAW